jgi:hypothetical protein
MALSISKPRKMRFFCAFLKPVLLKKRGIRLHFTQKSVIMILLTGKDRKKYDETKKRCFDARLLALGGLFGGIVWQGGARVDRLSRRGRVFRLAGASVLLA